jgi:glycosyltransferase involved in cell wall biosynthesis
MAAQTALLEAVAQRADQFDVIHAHIDWLHLPIVLRAGIPFLTTLHGRLPAQDPPYFRTSIYSLAYG